MHHVQEELQQAHVQELLLHANQQEHLQEQQLDVNPQLVVQRLLAHVQAAHVQVQDKFLSGEIISLLIFFNYFNFSCLYFTFLIKF